MAKMSEEQAIAIREEVEGALAQSRQAGPLTVDARYVQETQKSLALLQSMVKEVLVPGRDYGPPYEGAKSDTLYDSGASLIISAFNCYAGHRRVLHFTNSGGKVDIVLEVPIIQRNTGAEVGSGIASCTVSETKYKYRWVNENELPEWGYTKEAAAGFKTRVSGKGTDWEHTQYQVPNPEVEELLNTVVTMASKRAETDAAKSLPGVGSALRELFDRKPSYRRQERQDGKGGDGKGGDFDDNSPRWTTFWSATKALGMDSDQVHKRLKVKTMKDWIKSGKSLDDAIRELSAQIADEGQAAGAKQPPATSEWDRATEEQVPDYNALEVVFCKLTGKTVREMYKELGVVSRLQMNVSAWDAFLTLKDKLAKA